VGPNAISTRKEGYTLVLAGQRRQRRQLRRARRHHEGLRSVLRLDRDADESGQRGGGIRAAAPFLDGRWNDPERRAHSRGWAGTTTTRAPAAVYT